MNDDSVDAMRYYVELKLLDDKKKFKRNKMNKTILKILYDVLIILTVTLIFVAMLTKQIAIVLLTYIILAFGNIRRFILENEGVRI